MRHPAALPQHLRDGPITQRMLVEAGFPRDRIRRRDLVKLHAGQYIHPELLHGPGPPEALRRAVLIARSLPECWLSHTTAARIFRMHLPAGLQTEEVIHLSQPLGTTRRIRRHGIQGHRMRLDAQDLVTAYGARIASASRTWLDLAPRATIEDLVVLGDQLVRHPYPGLEPQSEPLAAPDDLHRVVNTYKRVPGRPKAVEALDLVRVGSDSPAETLLRLALVSAGLPEPALQVPANPSQRLSPCADMGYPELKIIIQYDGATHAESAQYRRDAARDNTFTALGWTVLRFTADDLRDGFRRAISQLRQLLAERRRAGGRSAAQ